jgi:hypothetical protein
MGFYTALEEARDARRGAAVYLIAATLIVVLEMPAGLQGMILNLGLLSKPVAWLGLILCLSFLGGYKLGSGSTLLHLLRNPDRLRELVDK